MTKTQALLTDLKKASARLKEATNLPSTLINQDATIQRFEFCFELAWKLMRALLVENGIKAYGPKNSIRESAKLALINNPLEWFEFLKARNLTVHTYEEKMARKIYKKAKTFVAVLEKFIEKVSAA